MVGGFTEGPQPGVQPAAAGGEAGHRRLREPLRYIVFGRGVPAGLYGFLGWLILRNLIRSIADLGPHPDLLQIAGGPVRQGLYLLFCAIPVVLFLTRPMPRARDGRVLSRLAAVTGTTMLLVLGTLPSPGPELWSPPPGSASVSTVLLVAMNALLVYSLLCLRRNFSILPEARRLVSHGPYRVIRHPLYAIEIGAALAVILPSPKIWSLSFFGLFVAIQVFRALLEERLLQVEVPGYAEYMRHTRRLIPRLW